VGLLATRVMKDMVSPDCGKTLKEKESFEVGIRPVLKTEYLKLLTQQGLWAWDQGKRTPSDSSRGLLPCRRFLLYGGLLRDRFLGGSFGSDLLFHGIG